MDRYVTLPSIMPRPPLEIAASNVDLDPTRRGRVESALPRLETTLKTSPLLRPLYRRFFTQGSYASRTAVRPLENGDFDVDAVLVLDIRKLRLLEIAPEEVVRRLAGALSANKWYADRLEMKPRCARIHYENGFHIDVVPAHSDEPFYMKDSPSIYIPTAARAWEPTHPLGFAEWFRVTNQLSGGRLRQMTLLAKRWRDLHLDENERPASILLTTLLGLFCPRRPSPLASALTETLRALSDALQANPAVPNVPNPSLGSEDLARDWTPATYAKFKMKLMTAQMEMQRALSLRGPAQRVVWRDLFGEAVPA